MRGATVAIINAITIYCSPCYNTGNSHVIKKPNIILVGDLMQMALVSENCSLRSFGREFSRCHKFRYFGSNWRSFYKKTETLAVPAGTNHFTNHADLLTNLTKNFQKNKQMPPTSILAFLSIIFRYMSKT